MNTHLILTVGTGTAGAQSNLAAGLRTTVEMLAPTAFWLIPSNDPNSQATADLIRDGLPTFQPWAPDLPYLPITAPDSLECCRQTVRQVIQHVRQLLPKDADLIVNPTSGTKQMSAGATIAALDEGIGQLVFTTGQRADGVVITGTETLERFDASNYFAERDLTSAKNLVQAGAWTAAATLLSQHPSLAVLTALAECHHEWERQNYAEARRISTTCFALASARTHLENLAKAAKEPAPQGIIIADILHTAQLCHHRGDYESALTLACRAMEMALRLALFQKTGLSEPYSTPKLCALNIDQALKDRCRNSSYDGVRTIINLNTVAKILQQLGHPLGDCFFGDRDLQALIRVRNDLMHQLRAVTRAESQALLERVKALVQPLKLPDTSQRPQL